MTKWVRTWEKDLDYIESLDGVDWMDAPLPRKHHKCRAQTRGCMGGSYVERCACGAYGMVHFCRRFWLDKNDRRRYERQQKKNR